MPRSTRLPTASPSTKGDLTSQVEGSFQLICANIVADVIIRLSRDVGKYLAQDGIFITSGIIDTREQDVPGCPCCQRLYRHRTPHLRRLGRFGLQGKVTGKDMPRFFTENIDQNSGSITGEDAKHIARVLRMKNGQPLTVYDTKGYDYACIIEGITEEQIDLKVLSRSPSVTEPNVSVHLYQAMPKADKLELIIQKAVELGVNSITPVMTRRCVSDRMPNP